MKKVLIIWKVSFERKKIKMKLKNQKINLIKCFINFYILSN